jgi:type I restriction enzyme M protein
VDTLCPWGLSDWRLTIIECDDRTETRNQCDRGFLTDETRNRQSYFGRKHMATNPLNQNAPESKPGFEAAFCLAADRFRNEMDPADYRQVVLGLLSLRSLSAVCDRRNAVTTEEPDGTNATDVFLVPPEARWTHLQAHAKQPTIEKLVHDAMAAMERDNPQLKDALYRNYDPANLSKCRLGELIDLISTIPSTIPSTDESGHATDLLGRVFEYAVIHFSDADSGSSGEYYTPSSVMGLFTAYDPCCGSGGMFAQSQLYLDQVGSSGSR